MIFLSLLILLSGCATNYEDYSFISKKDFTLEEDRIVNRTAHERPARLVSGRAEVEEFCESQILFNKNAFNITRDSLPALVRQSCPGQDYLLDATITKRWWTTLVYSRSCIKVESYCPKK